MTTKAESRQRKAETSRLQFLIRHASFVLAFTSFCLAAPFVACAHDGPEHEIEELTERIKVEGESADLLLQRAIEYGVIRKSSEAIKDLERALHYEAQSAPILRELSRAYLATGKTNEASDTIKRAIKYAEPGAELGSAHMVQCEIRRARRDYAPALEAANLAIAEHADSVEWYLTRSALQQQLGQKKERIKGLEDGIKHTGSGLLENEWLDALIDGGKADLALARIESELDDARIKSTWLLRRAKVRLATNKKDAAKADLEAALKELDARLAKGAPDPLVLMDRGQVHELLGHKEEAKKDYETARDKGVGDEWLRERIRVVKGEDKKDDKKKSDAKKEEPKKDAKDPEDKRNDDSDKKDDKADDDKPDDNKGDDDEAK
jgi:predicted negative regulator of RcsB-dependent stress response